MIGYFRRRAEKKRAERALAMRIEAEWIGRPFRPVPNISGTDATAPIPRLLEGTRIFPAGFKDCRIIEIDPTTSKISGEQTVTCATGRNFEIIQTSFAMMMAVVKHDGHDIPNLGLSTEDFVDPHPDYLPPGNGNRWIYVDFPGLTPTGRDPKYILTASGRTEYYFGIPNDDAICFEASFLPDGSVGRGSIRIWHQYVNYVHLFRIEDGELVRRDG